MGLYRANGQRVTQSNIATGAVADPEVRITEDLYERRPYNDTDRVPEGGMLTLFARAGKVVRQSELSLLFPDPSVSAVSPASGPAAGGTVVTLTGHNLDGVTAVTLDGAAGTALTVLSDTEVRVTVPAGAAGPADVVVTDDGGQVTKTAAFTYTA